MVDAIGQEITPGCIIVYGVGRGDLQIGKVTKVGMKNTSRYGGPPRDEVRIGVNAIHERTDRDTNIKTYFLADRVSTLQFSHRLVVLDESKLPAELKRVADELRV